MQENRPCEPKGRGYSEVKLEQKVPVVWVPRWSLPGRQTHEHLSFYPTPLEPCTPGPFKLGSDLCRWPWSMKGSSQSGDGDSAVLQWWPGTLQLGTSTSHFASLSPFLHFWGLDGVLGKKINKFPLLQGASLSLFNLVSSFTKGRQKLPNSGKMVVVRVRLDCGHVKDF